MLLLSNILQDVCVKVSRIKQLARKGIIIAAIAIIISLDLAEIVAVVTAVMNLDAKVLRP